MRKNQRIFSGISALLMLGAFSACNGGGTQVVSGAGGGGGTLPTPGPTVCPAWGCGPAPVFPIHISNPTPTPVPTPTSTICAYDGGCGGPPTSGPYTFSDSAGDPTKDVDLQRADIQQQSLEARAQAFATQFQMGYETAFKVTQLSDEVQALTANGQQMTAQDQAAVTASAFAIAGVTPDEVTDAITQSLKGDNTAEDDLITKTALNLDMPTTVLRDQLLPAMGIQP